MDQYTKENDSIVEFMKTHFYNYEDFNSLSSNSSVELSIDTIAGDNLDKTPIFDQVSTLTINLIDENDEVVPHNMYYVLTVKVVEQIHLLLTLFLFHTKA